MKKRGRVEEREWQGKKEEDREREREKFQLMDQGVSTLYHVHRLLVPSTSDI